LAKLPQLRFRGRGTLRWIEEQAEDEGQVFSAEQMSLENLPLLDPWEAAQKRRLRSTFRSRYF